MLYTRLRRAWRTAMIGWLACAGLTAARPLPAPAAPAAPAATAIHWRPLCEPGQGGATTSLQVSPHDPRRVLCAGDMLGIALSTDGGSTWQPTFGLKSYEVADFTFHPANPEVVWAGTMSGPYRSDDGGRTWQERRTGMAAVSGGSYSCPIERILFDPAEPRHLLAFGGSSRRWQNAAAFGGVWESRDGGQAWAKISTVRAEPAAADGGAAGLNVVGAAFAGGSGGSGGPHPRLFVVTDGHGVFRSDDAGRTWEPCSAGLPHLNTNRLAVHPADPETLWVSLGAGRAHGAAAGQPLLPGGVFKSTDGGRSWKPATRGLSQKAGDREVFTAGYNALAVSPSRPDLLYTCDTAWDAGVIYRSTDGGANWAPVASRSARVNGTPVDQPRTALFAGLSMGFMAVDPTRPDVAFAINSEFLLRTSDCGKTWQDVSSVCPDPRRPGNWRGTGFTGWCSTHVCFNPAAGGDSVLQGMDACKLWRSTDDLHTWSYPLTKPWPWGGGDDACYAGAGDHTHLYATCGQFGMFLGVGRTRDNGATWDVLAGPEHGLPQINTDGQGRHDVGGVYAIPAEPRKVWAVIDGRLYHSSDAGEHWAVAADRLGLAWLAGDPSKPARFYASGKEGVYVCDDGATDGAAPPALRHVGGPRPAGRGRLTCDARGRLYACQYHEGRPGLWRYTPDAAGSTGSTGRWERLLDEASAAAVAADPADPQRLALVTTDDPYHDHCNATGVWLSADGGRTWGQANDGLPMLRAQAVAFDPHHAGRLIVGTFGRGFSEAEWPAGVAPAAPRTYAAALEQQKEDAAHAGAPPPATKPVEPFKLVVRNGGMTQGLSVPAEWNGKFGDVTVTRDTKTFKEGPASLCVEAAAGKSGQAFQSFTCHGGESFSVSGFVKSAGKAKVNVAVQAFDEKYTQNQFIQLKFVQGDTDWASFTKEVKLPDWADRFNLLLMVEGDGKAWLDEVHETNSPVDPGKPTDPLTSEACPPGKPWDEGWGFYPQFPTAWQLRHQELLRRTKQAAEKHDLDVLFLGDSITQGWATEGEGKPVWDKVYAPLKAADYGIGGDSSRQVLWRLNHGEVEGIHPKVVVLMIGTNNLYGDQNAGTDEEIAKGIAAVVESLRHKLPETKILLLGILPRQNDYFCGRIRRINEQARKLDDGKNVRWLDMGGRFELSEGKVKPELFKGDQLHLVTAGYQQWADAMAPLLAEMLK